MGVDLHRIPWDPSVWSDVLSDYPDAEVYHSPEWLEYLAVTQGAKPVIAEVRQGGACVGHFVGATVRRFGLSILGSPLAGWGTQMMGFMLHEGVDRRAAMRSLLPFAYDGLGCVHVDVGDRHLTPDDMAETPYVGRSAVIPVVDLSGSEEAVLAQMRSRTRTYTRRAAKHGLRTEIATGKGFAKEYYEQLVDVFRSSGLTPTYGLDRVRHLVRILEPSGQLAMIRIVDADGNRIGTSLTIGRNGRATLWGLAFYRKYAGLHPVEPLQWATMRYWRERGFHLYDLAGDHRSKAKFSSSDETLVRFNSSRYPILDHGRRAVRDAFYARQRLVGRIRRRNAERAGHLSEPTVGAPGTMLRDPGLDADGHP